ncbi:MAG: RluA family pseudouridine synthase [Thermoguttaceae bacterium]
MITTLYEDNHLLVVSKPSGLATMGLAADEETLLTRAKIFVKEKYNKPGNVYLGVVSRLDVPVSGVVVFARTSKSAARLNDQFRSHNVDKIYLALVEGVITPPNGTCIDNIQEDERHRKVWISSNQSGKESRLYYNKLQQIRHHQIGPASLVQVRLETGRKHQIRVQLAHLGFPIVGDRKYGAKTSFPEGIALHAHRLNLDHPITGERMTFIAPLPKTWNIPSFTIPHELLGLSPKNN